MTDPRSPIPDPQRIAILADIHGNSLALDAALADIEAAGGVDATWLLGDYVAIGFDPLGVLKRLFALPKTHFIRGNTDRLAADLTEFDQYTAEASQDLDDLQNIVRINRSFAWTAGAVTSAGWMPWLADLPLEKRITLPDGTRVLLVHAAPGTDDGAGIHPNTSDEELGDLIAGAEADLIFIGHTHAPLDRQLSGVRVVNPGSIGNPVLPDAGACYALLEAGPAGYNLSLNQASYDKAAAIAATDAVNHPAAAYIKSFLRGQRIPIWANE